MDLQSDFSSSRGRISILSLCGIFYFASSKASIILECLPPNLLLDFSSSGG